MKTWNCARSILVITLFTTLVAPKALADKYKTNNIIFLNQAASWTNNAVPDGTEFGVWNAIVTAPNTTNTLGADMTWGGVKISNPGASICINGSNTLTLDGVTNVGVDMGNATRDLTINCALSLASNQTWNVNSGRTLTVNGVVSGLASLVTSGRGTNVLNAADSCTGSTTVSNGTLLVNGSLTATSAVDVKTNATLGGNGAIGGPVTVESGGTLSPGVGGIGTLTVSNNLNLAGTTIMELNKATVTNDHVAVAGTVTYGGTLRATNLKRDACQRRLFQSVQRRCRCWKLCQHCSGDAEFQLGLEF